jgi:uncharacterized membrane protein YdbT with pleckstrin-like domain
MAELRQRKAGERELKVFRQCKNRLYLDLSFVFLGFAFIGVLLGATQLFQITYLILILIVFALIVGFAVYINWYFTTYIITTMRVEYRSGIISKMEEEISLDDIQSIDTKQDIVGRIFHYGDIYIEAAGANLIILKNVHQAHRLAHEIATLSLEYNKNVKFKKDEEVFSV